MNNKKDLRDLNTRYISNFKLDVSIIISLIGYLFYSIIFILTDLTIFCVFILGSFLMMMLFFLICARCNQT